jgi:dolichol-phosphate mannosyltransferase
MTAAVPFLSICAPAYDEEACIEETVRGWLAMLDASGIDGEVIVANDGSRDRTGAILDELAREDGRVRHVTLGGNQGYGRALRAAIAAARGELVATIDSDGQFDANDIPRMLERQRRGDLDLVNGRREKNDTPLRVMADRGLNLTVRALFGTKLRDTNCALKLVRRSWLAGADLRATGFVTPTEMVVCAEHDGLAVAEVDVAHLERAAGESKLRLVRTSVDTFRYLVALRKRLGARGVYDRER